MYRNQYHYSWTDYHFLFTSNLSSYTYNRTCLISFLGGLGGITSSTYWNKRYGSQKGSWGNLIDSFKENTKYVYSIYLKLNDKGYNENYYFDKNTGYRKSGICEIDGNKYFFKESGVLYVNRWINLDGKKRYADKNGVLLTGFQTIDGRLYYLDPDNEGIAVTGGTDWPIQKIKGKYYAVKDTGLIFTGGWKKYTSGKTKNFRYFDKNGVMKTGWFEDKDGKYYLQTSGKNRGMRTIGTASINSVTYAFSAGGKLIKNSWYNDSSSGKDKEHWMYFGKDGKQVTGWKTIDKEKYYYSPEILKKWIDNNCGNGFWYYLENKKTEYSHPPYAADLPLCSQLSDSGVYGSLG